MSTSLVQIKVDESDTVYARNVIGQAWITISNMDFMLVELEIVCTGF